jgi:CRP-like cAMP-binding protein
MEAAISSGIATDLDEVREALRLTELFEMLDDSDIRRVAEGGTVRQLARGELLFRRGEPGDCIHLLLDGAIEIVRSTHESPRPVPVAYISPGELIGDMALFTGTPRRSDGRVPQEARVWTLTRAEFDRLAAEMPGYGMELTRMFARRLQDLITHMRRHARRKDLAGELKYFDMPTVVQTLITAGQTGLLVMLSEDQEVFAQVLLRAGRVDRARCGELEGEEAFHEIFLRKDDGEFYFRSLMEPDPEVVSAVSITCPAMHLMMDAMRRADELAEMRERLDGEDRTFRATRKKLRWNDERTAAAAAAIHAALAEERRLEDLRGTVPCSTFTLYRVAGMLLEAGEIG